LPTVGPLSRRDLLLEEVFVDLCQLGLNGIEGSGATKVVSECAKKGSGPRDPEPSPPLL